MAIIIDFTKYTNLPGVVVYGLVFIMFFVFVLGLAYALAFILRECTDPKRKKKIYRIKSARNLDQHHQQIVFIRHAQAKHNADFKALNERDPPLTDLGIEQSENRREMILNQFPNYFQDIDLVVCSPLRRTLKTMFILFKCGINTNKVMIEPLAAERGNRLCNIGSRRGALSAEFPEIKRWQINEWEDEWWQYPEDEMTFNIRMQRFKTWIQSRRERNILIVTHEQVIRALTSKKVLNADMVVVHWPRPQRR